MTSFPRIPINPCLTFGDPLEKVCTGGRLHPGLKELFTKAYFSAHQNECLFYDEDPAGTELDAESPGAWLITILKFGQGTVAVRLALKTRLETGRWLLPLQVPPAAPLWLIRHFLGRLPTPLILCSANAQGDTEKCRRKWLRLSTDCRIAMHRLAFNQKIHGPLQKRLALALDDMTLEACLTLISLITLMRNLSYEVFNGWIDKHAVTALVEYFTPSLISRPYCPGYLTKDDKRSLAVFQYLCFNLPEVRALCRKPIAEPRVRFSIDSPTDSSILQSSKTLGTPPALKKVLINDLNKIFSKGVSPVLPNRCPQTEPKPKDDASPKESPMELDNEIKETASLHHPFGSSLLSDQNNKIDPSTPVDSNEASDSMDDKKEASCLTKPVVTYPSILVSSIPDEDQVLHGAVSPSSSTSTSEGKVCNSTTRKCQAVKLAYKLRGQWLAWKLAGLFIEGATSSISGVGYSKLPHDPAY